MAQLHVRRSGSGPPLVLIHGVAGSGAIWNALTPLLEPHFDVIRLDLLGYGFSPKPHVDYTAATHVQAIHGTLKSLKIAEPYTVIGLSMGALLALDYAATYPKAVSAILCLGVPYYRSRAEARAALRHNIWTNLVSRRPLLARLIMPPAWAVARNSGFARRTLGPTIYSDQITKESAMATRQAFAATTEQVMVRYRLESSLAATPTIPKLFIHGSRDQWTPAKRVRELVAGYPHTTFEEIEGSAHNVAVLYPEVTAELITEFLNSIAPASRAHR